MTLKNSFRGEIELKFFMEREFETIDGVEEGRHSLIIARNVIRLLMMGWTDQWTNFLSSGLAQAVFVKRDRAILKAMRFAFQQGFLELFDQLKNKELTATQKEQTQLYLSNCLAYLPYADLTPYESFKIPQYIDGCWELVEYQVKPIELTKNTGWRRFFVQDTDRVFAYGLEPIFHETAESHLIFMGTTYPAGQGFISQVNTDSKGFETVGESLYEKGRERIHAWLSAQNNSVHVCGVSLGGSLSLLLALDKGNFKLSRIDALNPAGLHEAYFKKTNDHWDELVDKPQVVVQKQGNDPVSSFGVWKDNWDIIQITPPKDKQGPNLFCDHFLNYAGFAETQFTYIDALQDNKQRKIRNLFIYSLGRSLIHAFVLLPYTYIVRPIIHYWMISIPLLGAFSAGFFALAGIYPGLLLLSIGATLFSSILASAYCFIDKKGLSSSDLSEKQIEAKQLAQLHEPHLSRNAMMDIYDANNAVDITLTYQQIHSYYKMMRCLLKEKIFLPEQEQLSKHVKNMSKKTLLTESEDPEKADQAVPFHATPAKAAHIKHSLSLVYQLGIENENLKAKLKQCYTEYSLGKQR